MGRPAFSILGLIIFLIIVVGAGILIYRFVVSDNTEAATVVINEDGKFALDSYKFKNDEVFKIQNKSNENQTIKKESDKSTLVEVNADSTSRELSLADDSETKLYLAGDEGQKTTIEVGSPSQEKEQQAPEAEEKGTEGTVADTNTSLPNTGPENNLVYLLVSILGFGLYKFSQKLLN